MCNVYAMRMCACVHVFGYYHLQSILWQNYTYTQRNVWCVEPKKWWEKKAEHDDDDDNGNAESGRSLYAQKYS